MNSFKKLISAVSVSFLVVGSISCGTSNSTSKTRLSSAGATFPAKIYTRWFSNLAAMGGPKVNYQAIGSGSGRKAFIDETVDFAASDDPMSPKDISKVKRGLVQIPVIGGAIAFGYNNPSCELKLTQLQAVHIAIGKIQNWSEVGCQSQPIVWVHRSDGSGTTKAFTSSMESFSKEWKLGSGKSVAWPTGIGGRGNAGVANEIRKNIGSIGYINQSYIKGNIKSAALQNLYGEFIKPNEKSAAIALNGIILDKNLAGANPNPSRKGAYSIATLTWILAYETGNKSNVQTIRETLKYMLSDESQSKAAELGFVPLKGEILNQARAAISKISK